MPITNNCTKPIANLKGKDHEYNGWTNRATWLINMTGMFDPYSDDWEDRMRDMEQDGKTPKEILFEIEDTMKWEFENYAEASEEVPTDETIRGLYEYGLNEVNWSELAYKIFEDVVNERAGVMGGFETRAFRK